MKFSINSLILWSKKKPTQQRIVSFSDDKVNIITGASRTGKSAIIPIIDYCLGSGKCTIPVDTIRNACEWFGVVFNLENEQLLLCRKEPGSKNSTTEMYIQRNASVVIPDEIIANTTAEQVKNILNELFSMSALDLDTSNGFFAQRPSYRDIMAFLFQPQNIVANADVLFYKTDTMEHKQKLINIFPYVLGALTPEVLSAKQEKERLEKEKKRIEIDLKSIKNSTISWNQEVKSWLSQARELGLTNYIPDKDDTFEQCVERLRSIVAKNESDSNIIANNIRDMSDELIALRKEEQSYSNALYAAQRRYSEMTQLTQTANDYEKSLQVQLGRLNISGWMRELAASSDGTNCPICGSNHSTGLNTLNELCDAVSELEKTAGDMQTVPAAFERELKSVGSEIRAQSEKLAAVRNRIKAESGRFNNDAAKKYTLAEVARFLGNMERAIKTYELLGADSDLQTKLNTIENRLNELRKIVNEWEIQKRTESALAYIAQEANKIVSQLDVERPNDPIEFIIKDLTIKVKNQSGRDDYLWEIGSASNWLAYHLALTLAFQKFFQIRGKISVPNFIFFDQPSQVYFPHKVMRNNMHVVEEGVLDDEDKAAVKKIFSALSTYLKDTKFDVQIVVTEHADDDIWGDIENIKLVERWRNGEKLVPIDWITNS